MSEVKGQGHSRLMTWQSYPCWRWGVKVTSSIWVCVCHCVCGNVSTGSNVAKPGIRPDGIFSCTAE